MWASLSLLAILVVKATAYATSSEYIEQRHREFEIVPGIIPEAPEYLLSIIYGQCRVYLGNSLPVCATTNEPFVSFPYPNDDILYTLVCFTTTSDLLAVNSTDLTLRRLVFNIPGGNIRQGDIIVPLTPPNTPLGENKRQMCYLYRQPGYIEITAELYIRFAITYYRNFNINVFVEDFNLTLIAGNFFINRRTLCDATCCATSDNSCANSCGSQGCSLSSSTGCNSYESSCVKAA